MISYLRILRNMSTYPPTVRRLTAKTTSETPKNTDNLRKGAALGLFFVSGGYGYAAHVKLQSDAVIQARHEERERYDRLIAQEVARITKLKDPANSDILDISPSPRQS